MGRTAVALVVLSLAVPASASAQEFGVEWIDRVTHQLEVERGPLRTKPVEWSATGGVAYQFDDNIFLSEDDEVDDSIIIPFARLRAAYADQKFEAEGDLLANYKIYSDEDDLDDDEERLYVKLRQVGSRFSLGVEQILQRVSDPLDVVFADRAERLVSNSIGRVTYDLTRQWIIEGYGNYQIVRFDDSDFADVIDNNLFRGEGSLIYRSPSGLDFVGQAGWLNISYTEGQSAGSPPDAWGWYVRGGVRGELLPRLTLQALAGWSEVESDFFTGGSRDVEDGAVDAAVNLLYEATETVRIFVDFSRHFTFSADGDPYQLVNRLLGLVTIDATPMLTFRARAQFDFAESTDSNIERTYFSTGGSAELKPLPWLIFDAGVTFRSGETDFDGLFETEYDNLIIHAGVAATY